MDLRNHNSYSLQFLILFEPPYFRSWLSCNSSDSEMQTQYQYLLAMFRPREVFIRQVTTHRNRDLLVRARITTPAPPPNTGNSPCNNRRGKCCAEIVTSSSFSSKSTGRTYNIRSELSYKSRNVVYLISCKNVAYNTWEKHNNHYMFE